MKLQAQVKIFVSLPLADTLELNLVGMNYNNLSYSLLIHHILFYHYFLSPQLTSVRTKPKVSIVIQS